MSFRDYLALVPGLILTPEGIQTLERLVAELNPWAK